MRPTKFQHAYFWQMQQFWFILMISIPWIIAFQDTERDKTYNLKIGFDLTRGSQGASSLRIRKFEDDDGVDYSKPALRAGSAASNDASSSSNEDQKKKAVPEIAVEMKAAPDSVQSDADSDGLASDDHTMQWSLQARCKSRLSYLPSSDVDRRQRSTKGLRAEEYEPQGAGVREEFGNESESDNSERR